MLAGIYYGAMYGGSTTSILVNIPGRGRLGHDLPGRVPDGPARAGRPGPRHRGLRLLHRRDLRRSSACVLIAPPLVDFALKFGPPEYFSLMILGLTILTFLTSASMIRALMMAAFGLILGTIGLDTISGLARFTFSIPELLDGVGLVPVVMGLFGISEVLLNIETKIKREVFTTKVKGLLPTAAGLGRVRSAPSSGERSSAFSWASSREGAP